MTDRRCCDGGQTLHWRVKDMVGQTHGRLHVVKHAERRGVSRAHYWMCVCECGTEVVISGTAIRSGTTQSCGCLQKYIARSAGDRTRTHGMSSTAIYGLWASMHQRCTDRNHADFLNYGARGITVCERWNAFEAFFADMGARPAGRTLNRKDNDLGYSPENCEWATTRDQARNTRATRFLSANGIRLCIADWAEQLGMSPITLQARLRRGWSEESAVNTPIDARYSRAQK